MSAIENKVRKSLEKLIYYIEREYYSGYDPYDALNSNILTVLSLNNRWLRIAFTQYLRRLPINIRPLLLIKKGHNPKALGLFLSGYLKLLKSDTTEVHKKKFQYIISTLQGLKSHGYSGYCWGYNFPWQNRERLFPIWTPTIVNTCFIGRAFLEAYELLNEPHYLSIAESACDFILKDLKINYQTETELCLSYTIYDDEKVYNSNMLGAAFLARVSMHTRDEMLLSSARKMAAFVEKAQNPNGSWNYGADKTQTWIDVHHTGFVLEALFDFYLSTKDENLLNVIKKGLEFFENSFFLEDGRIKLWHDKNYPIDIHSVQAIVTLVKLQPIKNNPERLEKCAAWMIDNMQDDRGYFYYRKGRILTNKISYMRWAQAWAFHALTTYLQYLGGQ